MERVQELIDGNINIQLMLRKRDRVRSVEKGLIAEAQ